MRRALAALGMLSALSSGLPSQPPAAGRRPAAEGLQVFVITIGQGALYFEKYGHNMLWFYDPAAGIDHAFNWGSFNFGEPGFLRRQMIGDPQYRVDVYPGQATMDAYRERDRTIVLQRLNLTAAQKRKALEHALWNAREENRYYRYDYYRDNCSTRVRDVIDLALGGSLKASTSTEHVPFTYRSETTRLLDDLTLIQFGVNVALGRPANRSLSIWESMFIPMRMRDALRKIRVTDSAGVQTALVADERVVYESTQYAERDDIPRLWPGYLIIGLLIAAELFAAGWLGRRSSAADRAFRFEVALWSLITGLFGVILLLAWLITEHVFWYQNENLLLLNPLSLFLMVLAPLSIWRPRWLRPAAICAVIIAMLGAVALMLKGLPGPSQQNVPLLLLFVPAHFAAAYGLRSSARRQPENAPS